MSRATKVIIAVIIVIIVAIVVGGAVAMTHKSSSPSSASTSTTTGQTPSPTPATTSGSSANQEQTASSNSVSIDNFAFSPAALTVKKGTTVTWTNHDSTAHTVVENDGQDGPKSGTLGSGQTYSFTYNTAGTFKYHCSIHPDMLGTVTVTE